MIICLIVGIASVNCPESSQSTATHRRAVSAQHGRARTVRVLLHRRADPIDATSLNGSDVRIQWQRMLFPQSYICLLLHMSRPGAALLPVRRTCPSDALPCPIPISRTCSDHSCRYPSKTSRSSRGQLHPGIKASPSAWTGPVRSLPCASAVYSQCCRKRPAARVGSRAGDPQQVPAELGRHQHGMQGGRLPYRERPREEVHARRSRRREEGRERAGLRAADPPVRRRCAARWGPANR